MPTLELDLRTPAGQATFFDNVIERVSDPAHWNKGALFFGDAVCLEGAIALVYRQTNQRFAPHNPPVAKTSLSGLLRRAINLHQSIMAWNDRGDLSHEAMLGRLRSAVDRIRNGEVSL